MFNRNKELYGSREVTENAIPCKSSSPETKTTENQEACHDLSEWNKRLVIPHFLSQNIEPSRA